MVRIPIILGTFIEEYTFPGNGKKLKIHNIDWCEGGLHLADIATKNVVDNYLNTSMKYNTERLEN